MIEQLKKRAAKVRSRAAVRAWQYRQRRHAGGVWVRVGRLLAFAAEAYAVSEAEAEDLMREGHTCEPIGRQLQPVKAILVVPSERARKLASAQRLPLRLGPELLSARHLVLVNLPGLPPHADTD